MTKPILKNQVFLEGQVEEHEIGLNFDQYPCPECDGSGEEVEDFEGNDYSCRCTNCGGSGVFYVRITKKTTDSNQERRNVF
ncbi:hypothetical protein NIES4074_36460 [Cylindrospermum sp. NIES-4074]|nr:hypothetical protein NIES4074_36460 [Cylindrospermum sp. NIES-4074]